jgi:uncharacterized protein
MLQKVFVLCYLILKINMGKRKLFNDPLYGLINFKDELLYEIIDEPSFQRLRRIKQMGLSEYVYSGATHPRFQHVIGATYLLNRALENLLSKGIEITDEERLASSIAILCHDMGHGPFSHALEGEIVPFHHEDITKSFFVQLEKKYGSIISLARDIFENKHPKKFLHQLISSQLDMDRLDYLSRDSYYTGVVEGVVGYDRIIQMINVVDNNIVVEEKGIHSIEKFLIARYMMYMQVYLHKTSLVAESMLKSVLVRIKFLIKNGTKVETSENLKFILTNEFNDYENETFIYYFSLLDDYDVWDLIKRNTNHSDKILKFLCDSLLNRKLFDLYLRSETLDAKSNDVFLDNILKKHTFAKNEQEYLIFEGKEVIQCYDDQIKPIVIQTKNDGLKNIIETTGLKSLLQRVDVKEYLIYPKKTYLAN